MSWQEEWEDNEEDLPESELLSVPQLLLFAGLALPATAVGHAFHLDLSDMFGIIAGSALTAAFAPAGYRLLQRRFPQLPGPGSQVNWRVLLAPPVQQPRVVSGSLCESESQEVETEAARYSEEADEQDLFRQLDARREPAVARLTVESIVRHVERNSYRVYVGRSLTRPGSPAIPMSIYKRHLKIIGASQYGKSSMAAALLDIITRTHTPDHVQLALLDLEDQTSRLFADLPHVAMVRVGDRSVRLHARTREQVLEYLGYLVQVMDARYCLSKTEIARVPVLLVYVEEFLALKDFFKRRTEAIKGEAKEQAKRDYAQLIYAISELARRGLKARVQLLLCAQVDYRDEDLQEALINITSGLSFCVRVTAAQAAGFYRTDLLKRNVLEDQVGQAVVEAPDCKDLVLSPEYDLEQRLFEKEDEQEARAFWAQALRRVDADLVNVRDAHRVSAPLALRELEQEGTDHVQTFQQSGGEAAGETPDGTSDERPGDQPKEYRLSETEIQQFLAAYKASGSVDRALGAMSKGMRYRTHARDILQAHGLRRDT